MPMPTTEWAFVLPKGLVSEHGDVRREGTMRLATGRDELAALRDPAVDGVDDPRLGLVVLSRVVTSFEGGDGLSPDELEDLFAADLAHLQALYRALNHGTQEDIDRLTTGPAPAVAPLGHAPAPTPAHHPTAPGPPAAPGPPTAVAPGPPAPTTDPTADDRAASEDAAANGAADAAREPQPEPEPVPKPRGRRARIEEIGAVSGTGAAR